MPRSATNRQSATYPFVILAAVTLSVAALEAACMWPQIIRYAHMQSARFAAAAGHASPVEALSLYQLSVWLDPHNQAAHLGLATQLLADNQPEKALAELRQAGQGSTVLRIQAQTLLELGRPNDALNAASQLAANPESIGDDLILACLTFAAAGQPKNCESVKPRLSSPEALQRIIRMQSGNLPLAAEMYATGLLGSSQSILLTLPTSFERNLLLGRVNLKISTPASVSAATNALEVAVSLNPASIEAHQLLASAYEALGQTAAAKAQADLASKLIAGRP